MKKTIIFFILLVSFCTVSDIFASTGSTTWGGIIPVTVSEDLSELGLECGPELPGGYYECGVEPWLGSIQILMGNIIRYATFLIGLVWVLFIVINGIMYSVGWDDKSWAKERIMKSVWWVLLLLLSGAVLNAIAPWIYTV